MKYFIIAITAMLWGIQNLYAQSGPGGVSTPTNNVFWFRSDKGLTYDGANNVTTWFDQANANDATNNNTPSNPLLDNAAGIGSNAEPAILFSSASSEYLGLSDHASINIGGATTRTIYFVFQTGADISTTQYLYQQGNTTDGIYATISAGLFTAGIYSTSSNFTISSGALSANTEYIARFTYDGGSGTLDLSLNGTPTTQVTSVSASIGAHTGIRLGSDVANANFMNGHIAEFIYYDVVINTGEARVLDNYLGKRYGIAIANDHYATPGAGYRYNLIGNSRVNTQEHNASTGFGGTLYLSENGADPLADDDHIFAGHNNSNLSTTSANLTGIADTERYNRIWFLEKTGTSGAIIEFDVVESGLYTDVSGLTATDFSLLGRLGTSGNFVQATIAAPPTFNGNRIRFTLTDGEMVSAYFTLGSPSTSKKWYVINSGDWSDTNTWTLDPAGAIYNNPDGLTPDTSPTAATDIVTILSGKTVTVGNGDMSGTLTKLIVNGTLDFGSSTGHGTVTALEGSGTIRLSDDILPTFTDASVFTSEGSGAGTVEYYGSSDVNLTPASGLTSFYDLVLNFNSTAQHLIVTSDLTINNDLTITQGDLQINDASTTRLVLDIIGDLNVSATGEISVGTGNIGLPTGPSNYHDTFHRLNLNGDFTNNGVVNFSNLTGYAFNAFPANGDAVTVRFYGQTDNTLTCNNTTNFYDFMLDKGTDQTYILTVNPSAIGNFRVFGRNEIGTNPNSANPNLGKPIFIKNGTLHLTGNTFIPSLSEGDTNLGEGGNGSWIIPETGALWMDGPNVIVWGTCSDENDIIAIDTGLTAGDISGVRTGSGQQQSPLMMGKFRLTDGTYNGNAAPGIFYSSHGAAHLQIEGGTMDVTQLRNQGGTPTIVYQQSGGVLTILGETEGGNNWSATSGIFDFVADDGVFNMSGGSIIIKDYNDAADPGEINGININVPEGNYSITGGTITIDITAPLPAEGFEIAFVPNFYNLNIVNDEAQFVDFQSDIRIANDFILSSGTESRFNGNDLTVGRNFNIAAGSTYTQGGNNTTTFNGNAAQTITLAGTYSDFYNVIVSGTGLKTINSADMTIANTFTIESGASIDNANRDIIVQGAMSNSGTHQSTGTGALEFSGGSGTYTVSGNGNGVFGNVNLNDAANDVSFSADQAIAGTLTFSANQLLDIDTHQLTMQGASANISGASATRFIQLAGNASDGGLSLYLDANETLNFPIGTDANADVRYTPVVGVFSSFADDGYISISVADNVLATTDGNGGTMLSYYWHVEHSGFSVLPHVDSYTFSGSENDDGTGSAATFPNSWRGGKVLAAIPFTRTAENNTSINNPGGHDINFDGDGPGFTLESANYSAGPSNRFNGTPDIYYSRQDGNFNTASTWSRNVQDGSGTQAVPTDGGIVIIQSNGAGDSHRVNVLAGINDLGAVAFDHDYATYPNPNSEDVPRLQFLVNGTYNLGLISGNGMVSFDATQTITVNGDFGDFGVNPDSYYLYFGGTATLNNIPTPVPNLMVESATYTIDQAISTNGNLIIQGDGTAIPAQDINIGMDLILGTWIGGTFQFPNSGPAVTVTVNGNIDYTVDPFANPQDRDVIVADAATDLEHTLILHGDIIHGDQNGHSLDLYNGDNARPRVILELQGENNNSYARSSTSMPDLYRVVMNKGTDKTYSFAFNDDFNISTPTAVVQPIELQNGLLIINDVNIGNANDVVLTNETNDINFNIPSTAGLQISAGTITVLGDDLGIALNGSIILDGTGILDMDGGNNNFIQYSSSGSASIDISGTAQLLVGSQIRESSVTSGGILSYTQSGGTALIGTNTGGSPTVSKPMFKVSGIGSSFDFTGGTLTIANHLSNTSVASLFLDPASSTIGTGTTFQFGDVSTASGFENLTIKSTISFYDLVVDNSSGTSDFPTLSLLNTPLSIDNDLTIESNTIFDAQGLALNIAGDFTNNGTFNSNSNTTTFNGSGAQTITGPTSFYNLSKTSANTVQLGTASNLTVLNNLNITSGTWDDNNNNITVSGTVTNTAIHTNTNGTKSNSGIILAGSAPQDIIGEGTFSRIEVNNAADVTINDNIVITEQVKINVGSLDIQGHQLTMNEGANFVDGSDGTNFSNSNMVQTRRSFTDAGVIKVFNGTSASPFIYPIGSGNKYTPVVVTLTQNSQAAATIAIRAADEPHPNVQEDVDSPEFVDADNVLQYYWEVTSTGMTDLLGNLTFTYYGSDAYVTSPFTLEDYNTARLLPDNSDTWNKLETGFNYQSRDGSNTLSFDISSAANDAEIGGDYTAGVDGAIPNQVQTVTSNVLGGTGNWTTNGSWDTNTAPRGAIVEILTGDEIVMDGPDLLAYKTVIDGTLTVSSSATNARLGRVSGSGTLVISGNGNLPAGIYDDFFNCATGGTLAFNDNNNYTLPNEIANLRNLLIDGTGTKSFPNTDITICNDLELRGGTTLNNDFNVEVEVLGNLTLTNGTLDLGSNTTFTINGDVTLTAGTLELSNSDLVILGNLTLDGGTLALGSNGSIDLAGDLTIAGGTVSGANSCNVNFAGNITKTSGSFTVDATTNTFMADGTGNQTISGDFTGAEAFNRLTVNKVSGDLSIIDGGNNDVEVDGVLTLTSQNIITNASNTLTVTSSGSISGGSSGSYVEGPLTKNSVAASANFTFPIGNAARFGYARIENVGTGGQNWTAQYTSSNANSGQTIDITTNAGYGAMVEISVMNSWTITPSGANTAFVELGVISGMGVQVIEDVRIAIYNGPTASEWVNLGGSPAGDESNGSITSQTASDFSSSTFSFGGITSVALPVELIKFTATLIDNEVEVAWTTSSESDNDYFEIERSTDGVNYEIIGTVNGQGTTNETVDYDYIDDEPYYGISYYRLAQVDYDGTRTVYVPVTVNNEGFRQGIDITIFPNPAFSSNVNLRVVSGDENSLIQVALYDLSGNLIHLQEITPTLGISDTQLGIHGVLNPGIYLMRIRQGNNQQVERLSIK